MHLDEHRTYRSNRAWGASWPLVLVALLMASACVVPGDPPRPPVDPIFARYPQAAEYIGLRETEAVQRAQANGLTTRVVWRDGAQLPHTGDLRSDRVNLFIDKTVVVDARKF
jgi:hypothetical protein